MDSIKARCYLLSRGGKSLVCQYYYFNKVSPKHYENSGQANPFSGFERFVFSKEFLKFWESPGNEEALQERRDRGHSLRHHLLRSNT